MCAKVLICAIVFGVSFPCKKFFKFFIFAAYSARHMHADMFLYCNFFDKDDYKMYEKIAIITFSVIAALSAAAQSDNAVACIGKVVPGARISKLAAHSPAGTQAVIDTLSIKRGILWSVEQLWQQSRG